MKTNIDELNGEKWPIKICNDEWYFKGRFIQKNNHPSLSPYTSFNDDQTGSDTQVHYSMDEAKKYCKANPYLTPLNKPMDFLK